MNKLTLMMITISAAASVSQAQLSVGGSAGKGSPSGPAGTTIGSSADSVRNSGVSSTVNRPTDNSPLSQAPDTQATHKDGLQDDNTAAEKTTATDQAKNEYLESAKARLSQLDQRVQTLDNAANLAPESMKSRLTPLMTRIHDRHDQAQNLVDKIDGDSGRQFNKDKLHLDTALNDLDSRLRDGERKFNK